MLYFRVIIGAGFQYAGRRDQWKGAGRTSGTQDCIGRFDRRAKVKRRIGDGEMARKAAKYDAR